MTEEELFKEFKKEFQRRRFVGGLFVAITDFLDELDAYDKFGSLTELYKSHERQLRVRGKTANTLIVAVNGGKTLSLRGFYNQAEKFFRVEHKRFDYPNAAPHATQAWGDYTSWIDALLELGRQKAMRLRRRVQKHVLGELPSHEVDPSSLQPLSRPFAELLARFDPVAKQGEPSGTGFQGMVFALIRADAPHLFLDVSKVGAGSKRLQRVGDIDGWQGARLVISAEVKSYRLNKAEAEKLDPFLGEVQHRKAVAMVAAASFSDEARAHIIGQGARAVSMDDMRAIVDIWDPLKHAAAFDAFAYYVHHVEKNGPLMERLAKFEALLDEERAAAKSASSKPSTKRAKKAKS